MQRKLENSFVLFYCPFKDIYDKISLKKWDD